MANQFIYKWNDPKANVDFTLKVYKPYLTEAYDGIINIPEGIFIAKKLSWQYEKLPIGRTNNIQFEFDWNLSDLDRVQFSELFELIKTPLVNVDDTMQPEAMVWQFLKLGTVYELSVSKDSTSGKHDNIIYRGVDRGNFFDNYDVGTNIVECKTDSLEYVILSQMINPMQFNILNSDLVSAVGEFNGYIQSYMYNPTFHSWKGWGFYNLFGAVFESRWTGKKFKFMSYYTFQELFYKVYFYSYFRIINNISSAQSINFGIISSKILGTTLSLPLLTYYKRSYDESGSINGEPLTIDDVYIECNYAMQGISGKAADDSVKSFWDYCNNLFESNLFRQLPNPAGNRIMGKMPHQTNSADFIIKKDYGIELKMNPSNEAIINKVSASLHNSVGSDLVNFSAQDTTATSNSEELMLPIVYNNTIGADDYKDHTTLANQLHVVSTVDFAYRGRNYLILNQPSRCWNFFYLDYPDTINFLLTDTDVNSEFNKKLPITVHERVELPAGLLAMAPDFVYPDDAVLQDSEKRQLKVINKDEPPTNLLAEIQGLRGFPKTVALMAKCLFSKEKNISLEVTLDFNTLYNNMGIDKPDDFSLFTGEVDSVHLDLTEWEPLYSELPKDFFVTGCELNFDNSTYVLKLYGIA